MVGTAWTALGRGERECSGSHGLLGGPAWLQGERRTLVEAKGGLGEREGTRDTAARSTGARSTVAWWQELCSLVVDDHRVLKGCSLAGLRCRMGP